MLGRVFGEIKDKKIKVKDISGIIHIRNIKNFRFRIGVYGLLIENNKVLVQIHPYTQKYGLPGGCMEIDETIPQALKREFLEETGLNVNVNDIFTIEECFFTNPDFNEDAHSLFLIYEVDKVSGNLLVDGNGDDVSCVKLISIKDLNRNNTEKYMWGIFKL